MRRNKEQSECGLTAGSYATQKQTGSASVSGYPKYYHIQRYTN